MKKNALLIGCLLAAIILFLLTYGGAILVPTNVNWLMSARGDWGTHYLGWFFYRNDPWRFPLGQISSYFYPLGTNVAFTDSIPLMAILFKVISPILPADFQYIGLWLLACDLLVAWYTVRLLRLFGVRGIYILLAVVFVVANPVLIFRGMHPALCAHWLILGSIYCYFRDPRTAAREVLREQFLLLLLAAVINPYLCCMVLAFALILPWKLYFFDRAIRIRQSWLFTGAVLLSLVVLWSIVGMINLGKKTDLDGEGYGLYSLNLNALYNSFSWSSIFPTPKLVSWHQYEGFMYLGAGIFLLLLVLLVNRIVRSARVSRDPGVRASQHPGAPIPPPIASPGRYRPNLILLLVLVLLYTVFALTNIISINDKVLFKIPLGSDGLKIANIFRASARFFWLPFYLILFYTFVAITRMKVPEAMKTAIFAAALLLQLYDTHRLLFDRRMARGPYTPPLDKRWSALIGATSAVVFYPPFEATYLKEMDYQDFSFLAAQLRKPVTIGYIARSDHHAMSAFIDSLVDALQEARASRALYITTPQYLSLFTNVLLEKKLRLSILDGYCYMYAPDSVQNKSIDAMSDTLDLANAGVLDSLRRTIQASEYVAAPAAKRGTDLLEAGKLKFSFERIIRGNKYLACSGWGFIENSKTDKGDSIFSILSSDKKFYIGQTKFEKRPDISGVYKGDYDDAGFRGVIATSQVDSGTYKIGLGIQNGAGRIVYALTDSVLRVDDAHRVLR
jgi:hypothetical protein